ncbi:MAG: thrombospondin type 3 repeat-containing protein, partial [Myxococcota bacterium]
MLNVRMAQSSNRSAYSVAGLDAGDVIEYYFTYFDPARGAAYGTDRAIYTHADGSPPLPVDSDGDGVDDPIDQYVNTPSGSIVDGTGCPLDSDGDGVFDGIDRCPGTIAGTRVDDEGCSTTAATTGIEVLAAGRIEFFVQTSGWADLHYRLNNGAQQNIRMVQTNGRNTWLLTGLSAGDAVTYEFTYWNEEGGFAENTPSQTFVYAGGTPLDSDGDGVVDDSDQCPGTPSGTPVGSDGCPVAADSDGDGVVDGSDQCPGTPAGTPVGSDGCPLAVDSDGDGVVDGSDQCPGTPSGTPVGSDGCPVDLGPIVPLYDATTSLEPEIQVET